MSDQPKAKREAPLSFRPLHGAASVRALAQAAGHTTNSFLNSCVYGPDAPRARRVSSGDERTKALLIAHVARACDGLSEVIERTQDPELILILEACYAQHVELRTWIMESGGRTP